MEIVASLILFGLLLLFSSLKFVIQHERIVVFRFGHVAGVRGPGPVFVIPFIEQFKRVDMRTVTVKLPAREVTTRDDQKVNVAPVAFMRVTDPVRVVTEVDRPFTAADHVVNSAMKRVFGRYALAKIQSDEEGMSQEVLSAANQEIQGWGLTVQSIRLEETKEAAGEVNLSGAQSATSGPMLTTPAGSLQEISSGSAPSLKRDGSPGEGKSFPLWQRRSSFVGSMSGKQSKSAPAAGAAIPLAGTDPIAGPGQAGSHTESLPDASFLDSPPVAGLHEGAVSRDGAPQIYAPAEDADSDSKGTVSDTVEPIDTESPGHTAPAESIEPLSQARSLEKSEPQAGSAAETGVTSSSTGALPIFASLEFLSLPAPGLADLEEVFWTKPSDSVADKVRASETAKTITEAAQQSPLASRGENIGTAAPALKAAVTGQSGGRQCRHCDALLEGTSLLCFQCWELN